MAEPRAKVFEYSVTRDRQGAVTADGATIELPESWSPEHLVLAGLLDCSLTSLRYYAARAGIGVDATAAASATITRRQRDGRYAFVEIECRFEVTLEPRLHGGELEQLLANAERDCFVGASLEPSPTYVWNVA